MRDSNVRVTLRHCHCSKTRASLNCSAKQILNGFYLFCDALHKTVWKALSLFALWDVVVLERLCRNTSESRLTFSRLVFFFSSSNSSLGWGPMTHLCLLNRMAAWILQAGPGSVARGSPWAEGHICWQEGRIRGLLKDVLSQINDLVFQMCSGSSSYQNWSFSLFSFDIRMWQTSHSGVFFVAVVVFLFLFLTTSWILLTHAVQHV